MSMLIERETSAGSEGARRATGDPAGRDAAGVPDPEVSEQAKRRRFTAEYKLRIVREADACKGDGDVAALLRREGLYSSHLSSWRRQRGCVPRFVEKERRPPLRHQSIISGGNLRVFENLAQTLVAVDAS